MVLADQASEVLCAADRCNGVIHERIDRRIDGQIQPNGVGTANIRIAAIEFKTKIGYPVPHGIVFFDINIIAGIGIGFPFDLRWKWIVIFHQLIQ